MLISNSLRRIGLKQGLRRFLLVVLSGVAIGTWAASACAQNESGGLDAGSCALKDHVYTCDGAKFHQALLSAQTVAIQVHNADGVARTQLTDLFTKKLNKTVAQPGMQADLVFLIVPIETSGVVNGGVNSDLGTLRVYSSTANGLPEHLLWAETYTGLPDLPWPAVVHRLISQFQKHFQIS
jgi:hypothetical protein